MSGTASGTALVTDSTACLPAALVRRHGLRIVPLRVVIDGAVCAEDAPGAAAKVVDALRHRRTVTTSRPSPSDFAAEYRAAAEAGARVVVSIHLTAELSGTYDAAVLGAREAPIPVHVLDSRTLGMGLGHVTLAAAEAIEAGGDADQALAAARKRAAATAALFYVDTLDYLRRGGRIGTTQALLGSALAVKPLLHVVDGQIRLLEKVRTAGRAISRLEELAVARMAGTRADVTVHHLNSAPRAWALAERLHDAGPEVRHLSVREVDAVIGAHVGPGLLAVVISPC
jgi:DegV family protein with EDD domain